MKRIFAALAAALCCISGAATMSGPTVDQAVIEGEATPQKLSEFIGQEKARANLEVFIKAAKARGEALDHAVIDAALHQQPRSGDAGLPGRAENAR